MLWIWPLVSLACLLFAVPADAGLCGDADGNGAVSITDGVQILRASVSLPSDCGDRICDIDGDAAISVVDGVLALRRAAGLSAGFSCGTAFARIFGELTKGGVVGDLFTGPPPQPTPNELPVVYRVDGPNIVHSGESSQFAVTVGPAEEDSLYVIALDRFGVPIEGFARLPLDKRTAETSVDVAVTVRASVDVGASSGLAFGTLTKVNTVTPPYRFPFLLRR